MKILKLGVVVTDTVSGQNGILTHMQIDQTSQLLYCFQPCGTVKTTKKPLPRFWVSEARLNGTQSESRAMPIAVLGSKVRDTATGFEGIATYLMLHSTGCVHFEVQPKGVLESGEAPDPQDFSIMRLEGEEIKKLKSTERGAALIEKNSPSPAPSSRPRL